MENFKVSIFTDSTGDLLAELVEVTLVFEEEAKRHAGVEHGHVDGARRLLAVVQTLLLAQVFREVELRVHVVRVEED